MVKITLMEVLGQMVAISATVMQAEWPVHNSAVIVRCQELTEVVVQSAMTKEHAFIKISRA